MKAADRADRERICRVAGPILAKWDGILVAYAYGSRIGGCPGPDSDLDIGYYLRGYVGGACLSVREEMTLASELSRALCMDVDLRNMTEAPLELRGRVLEDGIRIYSSNETARVNLERDLLGRYHDYKDVFRHMHEIRLRRLAAAER